MTEGRLDDPSKPEQVTRVNEDSARSDPADGMVFVSVTVTRSKELGVSNHEAT